MWKNSPLVILISAVAIAFGLGWVSSIAWTDAPSGGGAEAEGLSVRMISLKETNRMYEVRMEYPQFSEASNEFNGKIRDFAEGRLQEFKANIEGNWKARQDTLPEGVPREEFPEIPFVFFVSWDSEQLNAEYASLVIRVDAFEGGANMRQDLRTFNYSFKEAREVALSELFPEEGENYLQKISKYARSSLVSDLNYTYEGGVPTEMIETGTMPDLENFKNFTFNDGSVIFYFPKYQVAPGAAGEQKVIMPRVITR